MRSALALPASSIPLISASAPGTGQDHEATVLGEGIRPGRQVPDEFAGRRGDVHLGHALGPPGRYRC